MANYSLRERLRYRFDNFMARGGSSIFLALVAAFLIAWIFVGALRAAVYFFTDSAAERANGGVLNQLYQAFNHLSDPGTMAYDIDSSPLYKVTAILAAMLGVVIFSALIAFITTALDQKLNELRKGHSKVVEQDHTLILGWNERVIEILRELILANESEDNPCVVILADMPKEEMDDYLKVHLSDSKNTRIVTRSGAESSLVNLDIVSVDSCKSIVSLARCNPAALPAIKTNSDNLVIKTILAATAILGEDSEVPIVAEIFHERNRDIVESVSGNVVTVDADDILSKILVQTSRSVGLSVVYSEILSFDGCEMYFHEAEWGEVSFGDLAFHFPDGIPMGIKRENGKLLLNPDPAEPMQAGDAILILAEDDSTIDYRKGEPVATPRDLSLAGGRLDKTMERELIIGWTPKVETIIREYADYVLEGSRIDILLRPPTDGSNGAPSAEQVKKYITLLNEELSPTLQIGLIEHDPLSSEELHAIEPFKYDNILILSQGSGDADDERMDSETIVILLLLRTIFREITQGRTAAKHEINGHTTKLITEVLNSENQELVARAGVNDFIISNRFISMLLAQISEDVDIKRVYDDLFQEDGSEIYLKPAGYYFSELPARVTYADMIRVAQKRNEVCLGVKIKALEEDMHRNFGVKLIPEKTAEYELHEEDTLVVLAEDET
jgi:ion channel POLLUX/CASTOR